jgi:hypothetical protein
MTFTSTLARSLVITLFAPALAAAQPSPDDWRFGATVYGFVPELTGGVRFPTGATRDINLDAETLMENAEVVAMGAFEVKRGRWGAFTDVVYFNVANAQSGTRALAVDGVPLPVNVSASADADIKAPVLTMAASYSVAATPIVTVDVFGGARMLAAKATLDWQFSTDIGGVGGPSREGSSEARNHVWDGIGGVRGRINVGRSGRLFIPFYADVGAGQSDLTWQVMAGAGYDFGWAEAVGGWRYLDYDMASDRTIDALTFNGPVVGFTFRW